MKLINFNGKDYTVYKFVSLILCVKCNEQLSFNQKMNSDGTCPYCGNINEGSIVDTKKVLYARVYPWWAFWVRKPLVNFNGYTIGESDE